MHLQWHGSDEVQVCGAEAATRLRWVPVHQGGSARVEELVNVIFKCLLVARQLGARKGRVIELPEGKCIQPHRPSHPFCSIFMPFIFVFKKKRK
jgi:hypothetical protein